MASRQQSRTSSQSSNGRRRRDDGDQEQRARRRNDAPANEPAPRSRGRQQQDYEEQDGWASAFHRPENEGNQPKFTGQGLDVNGDPIEVAIWVKRARSGQKYLRIHIQEPWQGDEDSDLDDDDFGGDHDGDDGELPF